MKKLLRSTLLIVLCNLSFVIGKAQWVSIPDTNFGTWLDTSGYSQCLQGDNTVGWQMDTTCTAVTNTFRMDCSGQAIGDLSGIEYFHNIRYLYCERNQLTSLPPLPNLLNDLFCQENALTALPPLPHTLIQLLCGNNQMTSLPSLPNSLTTLRCEINQLTSLPILPNSLADLTCNDNFLTNLPSLPTSLRDLRCYDNQLDSLPVLPNTLYILLCSNNQLTSLPALGDSLYWLDFSRNQFLVLPTLPNSLAILYCGNNQLTSINTLPYSLKWLQCGFNQLISLPALPDSLEILYCNGNNLTRLPPLPNSLTGFYCASNQLTEIPELPDSLYQFDCKDNPNIICLPQLKKVKTMVFSNTGITCLPNYPQSNTFSNPALNTIPLCDQFNNNGCSVYWNITGKVYNDTSSNCTQDVGETNIQSMKVNLYQNGVLTQQNYSGVYGIYSFDTDLGTYETTIDTTGVPFDILCPVSRFDTSVITALDSFDYDKDFALQCKPGFDVGAWSLVSYDRFVPARISFVNIHAGDWAAFWGQHCNTTNLAGQLVTTITGAATFISPAAGALTPSVAGNTLTYNISNWSSINPNTDFNIMVQTDTAALLGSQICFDVNVTPVAGDNNPANNILTHCFTVVGSYDPNLKEVSPVSGLDAGDWLTYTIHFQNTGTAEAQHIYVTDTLDRHIDPASFQLLAYSHQPMVQIKENAVRFNFPNINLPDSNTNEPLSHGYVQYKVKLKNNLPLGTTISNTAFIYFDFNAPVVTNTVSNAIVTSTGISQSAITNPQFAIHPNPASSSVNISIDERMLGSHLTITDAIGRKVTAVQLSTVSRQLSTENFSNGIYFVTIENERGRVTKKLVVQK